MKELVANIHIHSLYSDGLKTPPEIAQIAAEKGIDVIMITDHNVFPQGFDGYYTFEDKKVLLITGEEIHDQNRYPQKNHLLALGIHHDLSRMAKDPQKLIDAINQDGGLSFIAHAYDPALPMFGEDNLSWVDWSISGFTGLEIWNNLSELKIRATKTWQVVFYALFPAFMSLESPRQIREIWDDLLNKGQKVVGIGGADAHTLRRHIGPFTIDTFPYSYHFRTINTHILLESPLTGSAQEDTQAVISALRQGHAFVGYDLVKPTRGFRFYLVDMEAAVEMGSSIVINKHQELIAEIPYPADCRLIRNGEVIDRGMVDKSRTWKIDQPGAYRLECYRKYLGKQRGWIFSNPVYVLGD